MQLQDFFSLPPQSSDISSILIYPPIYPPPCHTSIPPLPGPIWNLSKRNRVTPVSIQDRIQHGITFAAISTIPAAPSPISAELSSIVARPAQHHKTLLNIVKHHEPLVKHHETLLKHCETSCNTRRSRRYRRGVFGDCGVGITPHMCNRVTNHGDMSTFSKPVPGHCTPEGNAAVPLQKLSSRNRVTPVSIQDRVQHGITFTVILPIPVVLLPISVVLLPIPVVLSQSMRRLVAKPSMMRRLEMVQLPNPHMQIIALLTKHCETLLNTCKTS